MGRYEEALKTYKECLTIKESELGNDHPDYAATLNNIGNTYHEIGRFQ